MMSRTGQARFRLARQKSCTPLRTFAANIVYHSLLSHPETHARGDEMLVPHQRWGELHGGLLLAAMCATIFWLPQLHWPWPLALPLLAYAIVVVPLPSLRRTAPRIVLGRLTGAPRAFAVVIVLTSITALASFHLWMQPDITRLAARLPTISHNLILGGICFSIVNAALEELLFRGVLWGAAASVWNNTVALLGTAIFFGLCHLQGYPPGPIGAVLAGIYGLALGILRWWTGGLGLSLACHVCADAIIFGMLAGSRPLE
jgi:membrane protease YdiL (CAAX protease family)